MGGNIKNKISNLRKFLINDELIACKNCSIIDEKGGKSYWFSNHHNENSDFRSTLVANQRFKNKCVFW